MEFLTHGSGRYLFALTDPELSPHGRSGWNRRSSQCGQVDSF